MLTGFPKTLTRLMVGSALMSTVALAPLFANAQTPGDVVVIGDSPREWSDFQSYWNQLINLNAPAAPAQSGSPALAGGEDPQLLAAKLKKNLQVSKLRLDPIIRLNGSSMSAGTLTNKNKESVTVSSINFEIVDGSGKLLQTGSAAPQPATLAPGQTVTFQEQLLTVPADGGYKIRLTNDPFVVQGGV
ncbi:MAG: FxLYD domain-containing protein [Thermosynechococcaceae cyanobacterium]